MSEDTCTVCGRRSARLHDLVVCVHHLRGRLAAAEAEVARLRGEYERGLREAVGACEAYVRELEARDVRERVWNTTTGCDEEAADDCARRILALLDKGGTDG